MLASHHASSPSFADLHALRAGALVVPETLQRELARPVGGFPALDQIADPHLQVEGELIVHVGAWIGAAHPPEAGPAGLAHTGYRSAGASSAAKIAVAWRRQLSTSTR